MARIADNTTALLALLSKANALPNAGSGTTETWTFTMEDGSTVTKEVVVV